jgi:hypothetical protein
MNSSSALTVFGNNLIASDEKIKAFNSMFVA